MGKHVQFKFRSAAPTRRRDSCLNFMHEPKVAFPTIGEALAEAARLTPRAGVLPEPYECAEHGWHLGTPRGAEYPRPYRTDGFAARNVHRLEWLVAEVGERATAQMFSESYGKTTQHRRAAITRRAAAALARAVARGQGSPCG